MKRTIFAVVVLAILFSSCDQGEKRGMLTHRGKEICNSWQVNTDRILSEVLNESFHLNAWIGANDSLRHVLESQYFVDTRIQEDGENVYGIYTSNGTLIMSVHTNGTQLSDADAAWEIHSVPQGCYDAALYSMFAVAFFRTENIFYLTAQGNNSWNFTTDSASCAGCMLDLMVSMPGISVPYDIMNQRFTIEGEGLYIFNSEDKNAPVSLQFNVEQPLCNAATGVSNWNAGSVALVASKSGYDDIHVEAEFVGTATRITYCGVTELWD